MSEESAASALGQIAFAEYYGRQAGAALDMPESWAMQSDGSRADWEAAAAAVAAEVVNPTAEDFDNAAEILRLRDAVTELLDNTGLDDDERARWLERAGIDL